MDNKCVDILSRFIPAAAAINNALYSGGKSYLRTRTCINVKIQQTVINNVKKIGLYAHPEPSVGEPMRTVLSETEINAATDPNKVYKLEIDIPSNSNNLKTGNQYFFRVGAIIDAPESKFNYAKAVRVAL